MKKIINIYFDKIFEVGLEEWFYNKNTFEKNNAILAELISLHFRNDNKIVSNYLVSIYYENNLFNNSVDCIKLLNSLGYKDDIIKTSDFISFEKIKAIGTEIFKQGYLFTLTDLLNYVSIVKANSIKQRFQLKYFNYIQYEKDRNISKESLFMSNLIRRNKYSESKEKNKNSFDESIKIRLGEINSILQTLSISNKLPNNNVSTILIKSMNDFKYFTKNNAYYFFNSVKHLNTEFNLNTNRGRLLLAFEPINTIVFDNKKLGLYNRETFENNNLKIYDGVYDVYYLNRLKSLTGF